MLPGSGPLVRIDWICCGAGDVCRMYFLLIFKLNVSLCQCAILNDAMDQTKKRARADASRKRNATNLHTFRCSSTTTAIVASRNSVKPKDIETASKVCENYQPIDLNQLRDTKCCSRASYNGGHFENAFRTKEGYLDLNAAQAFVLAAREKIATKTDDEMFLFLSSEYSRCLASTMDGRDHLNWEITGVQLCRRSFAYCYGIAENVLKTISAKRKDGDLIVTRKQREFSDATRLPYTFAEMGDLFATNGLDPG